MVASNVWVNARSRSSLEWSGFDVTDGTCLPFLSIGQRHVAAVVDLTQYTPLYYYSGRPQYVLAVKMALYSHNSYQACAYDDWICVLVKIHLSLSRLYYRMT